MIVLRREGPFVFAHSAGGTCRLDLPKIGGWTIDSLLEQWTLVRRSSASSHGSQNVPDRGVPLGDHAKLSV